MTSAQIIRLPLDYATRTRLALRQPDQLIRQKRVVAIHQAVGDYGAHMGASADVIALARNSALARHREGLGSFASIRHGKALINRHVEVTL